MRLGRVLALMGIWGILTACGARSASPVPQQASNTLPPATAPAALSPVAAEPTLAEAAPHEPALLFTTENDSSGLFLVWVAHSNGTNPQSVFFQTTRDAYNNPDWISQRNPSWSPDGSQIAFSMRHAKNENRDIYLGDVATGAITQLTDDPAFDDSPTWSPDGRSLIFSKADNGDSELYRMNIDGSNLQQLTSNDWEDLNPDWAPDGSLIVFTTQAITQEGSDEHLALIDADGNGFVQLETPKGLINTPKWSPDSQQIAYTFLDAAQLVNTGSAERIRIINRDGTNDQEAVGRFGTYPNWTPDGSGLVYRTSVGPEYQLHLYDLTTDVSTVLLGAPADPVYKDIGKAAFRYR